MTVYGLVSVKGSPGVTTVTAALATVEVSAGGMATWVELDPSGGSGQAHAAVSVPATLTDVARFLREGQAGSEWLELRVEAPLGVPVVLAPAGAVAAAAVVAEGGERWAPALAAVPGSVMVDLGRWDPTQPTVGRLAVADVVGVVCRSTLDSVRHLQALLPELRHRARRPLALIVIGTAPYSGADVAASLGLPLAGVLEWRRSDVGALWSGGAGRHGVVRSPLGRDARTVLEGLVRQLPSLSHPDMSTSQGSR